MGKRGATSTQKGGTAAAKSKSRRKVLTDSGPPAKLPPATESWARPPPSQDIFAPGAPENLRFFLVDIEEFPDPLSSELRLYGTTTEGCSVCVRLQGFRPYFYVPCPPEAKGHEPQICEAANQAVILSQKMSSDFVGVVSVETVQKTPAFTYQPECDLLMVTVAGSKYISPCVKAFEQGIKAGTLQDGNPLLVQCSFSFEANVAPIIRMLVDKDLGGGRWAELPAGTYYALPQQTVLRAAEAVDADVVKEACSGNSPKTNEGTVQPKHPPRVSGTQVEVIANADRILAVPLEDESGSALPPLRKVALQTQVGTDGLFHAAALVLSVHGESLHRARAVWLLTREQVPYQQGPEWSEVRVEEYDPNAAEPAAAFTSNDIQSLLDHLGQTLEMIDADILVFHDMSNVFRALASQKGAFTADSPLTKGLRRRLGESDIKVSAKTGEVAGLAGRLPLDLQKTIEKEHKLNDYSLGGLLETFCALPLPEFRENHLSKLRSDRPRACVQHVLRQAEACLQIFDRLALLFNFVEMARVTGCPLSYILDRGQAVKVHVQLLRECRKRGFVLPSQRPATSEENSFEGATVLSPACGFYEYPVAVLDFASLYPSIMMAQNLCYSTLLPPGAEKSSGAPEHKVAPQSAADDVDSLVDSQPRCFVDVSVRKGLLPSILEQLLSARSEAKRCLAKCGAGEDMRKKVLHGRQLALKLSANSVYGFTGAMNGPLPCLALASSVTAYGREMLKTTKSMIERHFSRARGFEFDAEVIYGDTDSVMVKFGPKELDAAMRLSKDATTVCTSAFPRPVRLEFEKIYKPFLLMNKKRYAGLAWTSQEQEPALETKGIETVRRDWSDLVRLGMDKTLRLLLRADGKDGTPGAIEYVRNLVDDLRQNKIDFRSLVISKTLAKDEYAAKTPHSELAQKMRKREPSSAPSVGDRVNYLVVAGAAKARVNEKAEDPIHALVNEMPIDAEYYLEHQLKQPLMRVFEQVIGEKAGQALFGAGAVQQKVVMAPSTFHGLGKFMKARPKCLLCATAVVENVLDSFCAHCQSGGAAQSEDLKAKLLEKGKSQRAELAGFRKHCELRCAAPSGEFFELPADTATGDTVQNTQEQCDNVNCSVIFRRVKCAKDLQTTSDALKRLGIIDW